MTKKNDKRLCWNCDGSVPLHLVQCPYCGVDLTTSQQPQKEGSPFGGFPNPFQSAAQEEAIPKPPYSNVFNEDEWNSASREEKEAAKNEEKDIATTTKREMVALLLLLPGVVFFLFGLALLLFSSDGILTLAWNQSFAYFYFLGSVPLLFLGWRALR